MGDVVGQPKSKDSSGRGMDGGKVTYEGVEYDHVFHIDVDEGVVLKLPYNKGQDPYKGTFAQMIVQIYITYWQYVHSLQSPKTSFTNTTYHKTICSRLPTS